MFRLVELLNNPRGTCCSELCEKLQINKRTLYRDLGLLRSLGHQLVKDVREMRVFYHLKIETFSESSNLLGRLSTEEIINSKGGSK
jgi:predicted DNA-binding transcriptional regulator YafY